MAETYVPGLQMQNWASLPSISETIAKQAAGGMNPLLQAIGYGINQLAGGNNPAGNYLQYGKSEAPQQGVAPPTTPQAQSPNPVPPPGLPAIQTPQISNPSATNQQEENKPIDYSKYLFR